MYLRTCLVNSAKVAFTFAPAGIATTTWSAGAATGATGAASCVADPGAEAAGWSGDGDAPA